MTQEEKQLLLIDLYARLPYGVIVHLLGIPHEQKLIGYIPDIEKYNIKPYLRPMSSMTEEEIKEYNTAIDKDTIEISETFETPSACMVGINALDWLNANHFDYRGLIPMGLALEAKEDMYKTE